MDFVALWEEFQWFFALGYVTVAATLLTMGVVEIEKKTIFRKKLETATASQKDKILGLAGTITSIVMYAICYVANEMILQGTLSIEIDWAVEGYLQIIPGAAVTWVAAKGLYTVLHKFIGRIKEKKLSNSQIVEETKKDLDVVANQIKEQQNTNAKTIEKSIGNVKKLL